MIDWKSLSPSKKRCSMEPTKSDESTRVQTCTTRHHSHVTIHTSPFTRGMRMWHGYAHVAWAWAHAGPCSMHMGTGNARGMRRLMCKYQGRGKDKSGVGAGWRHMSCMVCARICLEGRQ